jgi:hypothetical protein
MDAPIADPYRHCETQCNHDLARGVGIDELWAGDGPYPPSQLIVNLSSTRPTLFDDELREAEVASLLSEAS